MSPLAGIENDDVYLSDEDDGESDDEYFNEDLESLRRACMLTGRDPKDVIKSNEDEDEQEDEQSNDDPNDVVERLSGSNSDDSDEELLRKIKSRFSIVRPQSPKPLCTLPPDEEEEDEDDDEDDYQTLLAVRRRFAVFESDSRDKSAQHIGPSCKSVEETRNERSGTDGHERCPASDDASPVNHDEEGQPSTSSRSFTSLSKSKDFPESALALFNAIKKVRACKQFLEGKLGQIEAKIQENRDLKSRVKILRDFQVLCKRRTGEALSQKKDPRVQLILTKRPRGLTDTKARESSAMSYGPAENSDVAKYRLAMTNCPLSLDRKNWSEVEKKDLQKGIRQQFQEMVLQSSLDESSYYETPHGDSNDIDSISATIRDLEISPHSIREFLPKVNWEQLASMYVPGRSGGECEARWLNWEDPLINREPWTTDEDRMILYLVQENKVNDWIDLAASLGTNRTPFQCLARYQRSLNASILKREWTRDEDAKLRSAVEDFGESDWQSVASAMEGRTGTQCSNRWKKQIHPTRTRIGKWTSEEDKRLTVAQMLFESKNWNKIAQFVPGRTQAQCRDRFVNSLEPSLKSGEWTEEEDSRLKAAIEEYGYCWSKVAACVPQRTDNMCWRRWKVLFPDEVLLLKEEKRVRKTALIRNFVDREEERPALGPSDFLLPNVDSTKSLTYSRKKRKSRKVPKKNNPKRHRNNGQICSPEPTGARQIVVYKEQDAHENPPEMSSSDQIIADDDDTLAGFLHKVKKRKQTDHLALAASVKKKSKKRHTLTATAKQGDASDDMTLACWFGKSKQRRR